MKSKTKIYILIALCVLMIASLAAGCKIGEQTKDEYLKANNATEWYTYFSGADDATFKNGKGVIEIYYPEDSYFICTETIPSGNFSVTRDNYNFAGWYYTSVNANGEPLKDEHGNYVYDPANLIDSESLNTKTTKGGKHSYLIARWTPKAAFEVHLVTENDLKVKVKVEGAEDKTYSSGDVIGTYNFGIEDYTTLDRAKHTIASINSTCLYFYEDAKCTQPTTRVNRPAQQEGEEVENVKVYAKYIEGVWNVVTTPAQAYSMMADQYSGNYYLYTPDRSNKFDCAGMDPIYLNTSTFGLNIQGNGVTIENLAFEDTGVSPGYSYAIFGKLTSSSSIKDLTLKNVSINTVSAGNVNYGEMYIFCYGIEEGATLENVAIENVSLTAVLPSDKYIQNIQILNGGVYDDSNWLFGGYGTDDEFVNKVGGVYITGANLSIGTTKNNLQTVFENISKGIKQEEN